MMAWFSVLIVTLTILSQSVNPAFARVLHRNFPHQGDEDDSIQLISLTDPFNFTSLTRISLQFNFTIGNGIALVIIPTDFSFKFGANTSFEVLDAHQFFSIQFYANVLKISSSSGVTNVSIIGNILKDGVNLSSWIVYDRISKRLEVRLTKLDDPEPVEPLISVRVDLSEIMKGEEVMFGLACSNTRHEKSTSWRLIIDKCRQSETYFGDLRDHELPPFPPFPPLEHSNAECYKENNGFVSWFTFAIIVCVLFVFFAWLDVGGGQKVQARGSKHGTTDSLEMKKNSEALSTEEC